VNETNFLFTQNQRGGDTQRTMKKLLKLPLILWIVIVIGLSCKKKESASDPYAFLVGKWQYEEDNTLAINTPGLTDNEQNG
jgi:hypothetical protein